MRNKGLWLSLGSVISILVLLMLLRCGGDGGGGGIITPQPASDTGYIDGVVYDASDDTSLEGARVTARGVSGGVQSDGEGRFFFPITESWEYILTIEKPGYTYAQRRARGVVGRDVAVDPVYLTPLDPKVTRIGPDGGTHRDSSGSIELIFPPGAVSRHIDVAATLYEAGRELPYPLPPLSKFTYAMELLPDGVDFSQPVQLRLQNYLGFPPGTPIPVGFYSKEEARWVDDGMAHVTSDGQYVEYELTHFSAIDVNLPVVRFNSGAPISIEFRTPGMVGSECIMPGSSGVGIRSGSLGERFTMPSHRSLGVSRDLEFVYNSTSARPDALVEIALTLDPTITLIPEMIGYTVQVEGVRKDLKFEADEGKSRFAFLFDGKNARGELLPSGSYSYRIALTSEYEGEYYSADCFGCPPTNPTGVSSRELLSLDNFLHGRLIINNQIESPFGAGWALKGLQRLHVDSEERSVLITEGDGSAAIFESTGTIHTLDPDSIYLLEGLAVDSMGRFYASTGDGIAVVRIEGDGTVTTIAGNGVLGYGGDEGPATEASLRYARDLAFDHDGNLYICDAGNFRIRKVDTHGIITTVAGNGIEGHSGDGGPATSASIGRVGGIAVDPGGNFYFCDSSHGRVRKVDTSGIITTIAGGGSAEPGDGLPATQVRLNYPQDVAIDAQGNLYIAVPQRHRVRKVDTGGTITTVAGSGEGSFAGDGGSAQQAMLNWPVELVTDVQGNLYIADAENNRIRKVDTYGVITTICGGGADGPAEGMSSTKASLYSPSAVALDGEGTLYIGEGRLWTGYHRIYRIGFQELGTSNDVQLNPPRGDYTKLFQDEDLTFTRYYKDGTELHFNGEGLHTSTVDKNGNTTSFSYDQGDRLTSVTDPVGLITTFSYDANGRISSVTDPTGRVTNFSVDVKGNLVSITDAMGATTSYDYQNHLVTEKICPRGYVTEYVYSDHGRISQVVYPTGEIREFIPSATLGLLNDIPAGQGTPDNPAPLVMDDTIYDTFTDGDRNISTYKTNQFGHFLEKTDPLGRTTLYERDENSNITRITLPNGAVIGFWYDSNGNLTRRVEEAIGAESNYDYHPASDFLWRMWDANGIYTEFTYDERWNPIEIRSGWTPWTTTKLTYDSRGLLTSITDILGKQTTLTHDEQGSLASVIDHEGNTTGYGCDLAGNTISVTDANGNTTTYGYDGNNRLTEVTDAEGNLTRYTYEGGCHGCGSRGLLSAITDANGNTTEFAYDEIGQLISVTDPLGNSRTLSYEQNRNLASMTDPNGNVITHAYDAANQLIQKMTPDNTVNYGYDAGGNLTSISDLNSEITMVYDMAGRLTEVSTSATAHQPSSTISYTYDKVGNRLSMTDATGTTTYYRDPYNNRYYNVDAITNPQGKTVEFYYDYLGRRTGRNLPNGITTTYSYTDTSRLLSMVHSGISSLNYAYDGVGNRVSMTTSEGMHSYTYDSIYQLLQATHPASSTEAFTYDGVGNRLSSSEYPTWTYDANNRLTGCNGTTYTYDNNGNMVTKTDGDGTTIYEYDSENRLIRITNPESRITTYTYDALRRRIEKNVSGVIIRYVYDGGNILFEYDNSNNITARYTHGPGIDEPLIMERNGASYHYHADGLGNIREITDASGIITASYRYDSFGKIIAQTGNLPNPYAYTSRVYDSESGLYYYRARYYYSLIGRFLVKDPTGMFAGINLYTYVENNPINYIDPTGFQSIPDGTWKPPYPNGTIKPPTPKYARCVKKANKRYWGRVAICEDELTDCLKDAEFIEKFCGSPDPIFIAGCYYRYIWCLEKAFWILEKEHLVCYLLYQ